MSELTIKECEEVGLKLSVIVSSLRGIGELFKSQETMDYNCSTYYDLGTLFCLLAEQAGEIEETLLCGPPKAPMKTEPEDTDTKSDGEEDEGDKLNPVIKYLLLITKALEEVAKKEKGNNKKRTIATVNT